jgi:hypothetical protein
MLPDPKVKCPATAFVRSCRDIVAECDCPKFVNVRGRDPQTGVEVDRHGCVDGFLPLLLIENAQMSRQTGAAVESFRNEMKTGAENIIALAKSGGSRLVKNDS